MIQLANKDLKLEELLIAWEEARERGESLTVESLCRDCPDLVGELARRIEALRDWDRLASDSSAPLSSSPEAAARACACACPPASACVTLELGGLHFHDRGGLGVIYKARHQDLPRDVALKFIRQDRSDDPQCSKRFLREAQITARLEHPGIVPIYGLGRDEAGNPCYAMRFVEGTTLEQAIKSYHVQRDHDRERGSVGTDRTFRALLQRFKSACTTIGYAHSRGVLHRDIKPGNIMLGPFEETLVVDWGLGKIIASGAALARGAGEDEREMLLPVAGSDELATWGVVGTPGFMSPEQHAGQWGKVGPASDIYALGATLYVLLTGKAPFDGRSPGEIAAKVERGEFIPPRQAKAEIPRPLEAICLKAMALTPEDRYNSAVDLAVDLEDWMAGEPVSAWREPWPVRARRWMSRNRTLATTGAVAMMLVLIGLVVILVLQDRSTRRLAGRNEQLRQARARAEGRVELALNAIDQFRGAVADNPQLKLRPEFAQLRKGLLRTPQEFYRQIRQDIEASQDTAPEAWAGLAKVILKLAAITAEIDSRPSAIHAYQEGLAILDRPLLSRSNSTELLALEGRALIDLGRLQREERRLPDALASEERARKILETLSRDQSEVADHRIDLAAACDEAGLTHLHARRFGEADASFEQAREILEKMRDQPVEVARRLAHLAQVYNHLGIAHNRSGQPAQALAFYENALTLQERLARERPTDPKILSILAVLHYNIGNIRRDTGRSGAVESYERSNEILEPLVREYRSIADFRIQYARSLGNLALVTSDTRIKTRAIPAYTRMVELQREGVELHPGVVAFRFDLAKTLYHLARANLVVDQPQDALRHTQEGIERLGANLATDKDPVGETKSLLGMIWEERAKALIALGRENEAVESLEAAIGHQRKALDQDPRSADYRKQLFNHHYHLAALRLILGQTNEAESSLEALKPLWYTNPGDLSYDAWDLARVWLKATGAEAGRAKPTAKAIQLYGALVVTMLERAVDAGFRNVSPLINDPAFDAFRARDDFQRLLMRMMDLAFPVNAFR
ncbi:MAG: protein kinase domain-containing protein [Isosphaeraceae bacterium]